MKYLLRWVMPDLPLGWCPAWAEELQLSLAYYRITGRFVVDL